MADQSNKKKKIDYHLMLFVDKQNGEIKQMGIGRRFIQILAAVIALIIVVFVIGWAVSASNLKKAQKENDALVAQAKQLQDKVDSLSLENDELDNKVSVLSDTVNDKVQKENEQQKVDEEAHMPGGFPLSSSASMTTDENDENEVIFSCDKNTNIIAAGAGTVTEVIPDADYGNCIKIDHGNGYVTEYYNASTPLVKEGDEVLEGSVLCTIENADNKLAYKVLLDGEEIDPMSVIKIDG